jgi:hypothetical protein
MCWYVYMPAEVDVPKLSWVYIGHVRPKINNAAVVTNYYDSTLMPDFVPLGHLSKSLVPVGCDRLGNECRYAISPTETVSSCCFQEVRAIQMIQCTL